MASDPKKLPKSFLRKEFLKKHSVLIALAALSLASSGAAYYFHGQADSFRRDPQQAVRNESLELISQVSKLMVLPESEEPTIATVSDPDKLKDQPFFARAKVGYKVLIYANARKAILFSPEENLVIEVAPLNIGSTPATPAPEPQTEE